MFPFDFHHVLWNYIGINCNNPEDILVQVITWYQGQGAIPWANVNPDLCWHMASLGRTYSITWWRHQMETFSALLVICAGNSPVTGEFPAQRPVTRSFDVFFYLCLNKRLSKQWRGWWFETPSCPLWRHCNENGAHFIQSMYTWWWTSSYY